MTLISISFVIKVKDVYLVKLSIVDYSTCVVRLCGRYVQSIFLFGVILQNQIKVADARSVFLARLY